MANNYFQFKKFTIYQDRCGMKVGTDATLLGAWAHGGRTILDIGTGTGIIALMMAQRYPDALITGIDIDKDACLQASDNVKASPYSVDIKLCDVRKMEGMFDAIITNPPYFVDSLESPVTKRNIARHTSSLSFRELIDNSWRLLNENGEFSLIVPTESKSLLESEAMLKGFFKTRQWAIKTTVQKEPKRYLLAFMKHQCDSLDFGEGIIQDAPNKRSAWYEQLTKDFYL